MTLRQSFMKLIYPLIMTQKHQAAFLKNDKHAKPAQRFYSLKADLITGGILDFETLAHKKVLLVNTASNCGYTAQFKDLQELYLNYKDALVIIGFPSNDFKEQEKGNEQEILQFCQVNFGVTFPLAKKSTVVKKDDQNAVFKWLTDNHLNGWNSKEPKWNFSKYLVDENGTLTHYFDPGVSPLSSEVLQAIETKAI